MPDFNTLFTDMCEVARKTLLENGGHVPQLMLDTDKGFTIQFLSPLPHDLDERHALAADKAGLARRSLGATALRAVLFVSEAWVARYSPEEYAANGFVRPSAKAQRKDVLVVTGRDVAHGGAIRVWCGEILCVGETPIEVAPLPIIAETFESEMIDAVEFGWKSVDWKSQGG